MNIRKQLKVGKKMRGVTSSIRPRKLKGLRVARRIKAIRKMNVAKRLRRSFTRAATATGTASTNTARMLPVIPRTTTTTTSSGKWIAIVKKKISSSTPEFPHYYNNKGRNGRTNNTSKNNMIIIHNNTSITGNEELDNRTSCVDEGKDINPLKLKEDNNHVDSIDSAAPLPPHLHQLASDEEDNKDVNNEEEDLEIIRLGKKKAAIHIQSVFRGHLARRACRALKSLVRLQAMVRGVCMRRQAHIALDCMNALVRLQFRVRTRQLLPSSPSNDAATVDHPSLD